MYENDSGFIIICIDTHYHTKELNFLFIIVFLGGIIVYNYLYNNSSF